jgi:DNA-binding transcriptional LysR family regulator
MNAMTQIPTDREDPLSSSFSASYAGVVAFITVATEGSFARAADRLGVGRSAVSRSVQKLEGQLGTRLFSRTTRCTSLTAEGELFFENCRPGVERILQALEEMRDLRDGPPRGQLRISATHGFGRKVIAPLMSEFHLRYPGIGIELLLDERAPDLAVDRVDVAFRDGRLDDSQVIAKQLIPMQMMVCASPEYARRHGLPTSVDELKAHACINRRLPNGRLRSWDFQIDGRAHCVMPQGDIVLNDDDLMLQALLDGQGLAQMPGFQVCDALRKGTLVTCLGQFAPDDRGHYLCYLSRRQLPKRIRAFIDFITTQIRGLNLDCATEMIHACGDAMPDADTQRNGCIATAA